MTDIDHEFKIFRGQTAMNKWSKVVFVVFFSVLWQQPKILSVHLKFHNQLFFPLYLYLSIK